MATTTPPAAPTPTPAPNQGQNVVGVSSESVRNARDVRETIKEIFKIDGDRRDILKDSIKDLQATLKSYEKMEAKLGTISQSTINIKELEAQIKRTREEGFNIQRRAADAGAKLTDKERENAKIFLQKVEDQRKAEELLVKAKQSGHENLVKLADKNVEKANAELEKAKNKLNVEGLSYAEKLKSDELNQEILNKQEEQLAKEKQVSKDLGIAGYLMGQFSEKLGIGTEFMETLTRKTREAGTNLGLMQKTSILFSTVISTVKEKMKALATDPLAMIAAIAAVSKGVSALGNAAGNMAKGTANAVGDFQKMSGDQVIGKLASGISGIVGKIPYVGGLFAGIIEGMAKLLELSLAEDDKITKIGRHLGISKEEASKMNDEFLIMSLRTKSNMMTVDKLVESHKEIVEYLGLTNTITEENLKTNIELSKLIGLDAKTRGSIVQSSIITGVEANKITKSIFGQVAGLKMATGIGFDYKKIIAEASGFSGVLGLQFAKYPEKLTRTLLQTKALGLELGKLNSIGDQFMNFEESISKEFEAQLITGKNINLNKAREAFLNNDLATAAKEISKYSGSAANFANMRRIEQDALAGAMGMSKDELADMLKQQEMLAKLGARDLKEAQAKVEALKAEGKTREEIAAIVGEEAYQNLTNMSVQEKIAGFVEKIQSAVANFLSKSPIVPLVERAIDFLSEPENIIQIVVKIQGIFATIFDIVGAVAAGIMKVANWFDAGIDPRMIKLAESGGDSIRRLNIAGSLSSGESSSGSEGTSNSGQKGGTTVLEVKKIEITDTERAGSTRLEMAPAPAEDTGKYAPKKKK